MYYVFDKFVIWGNVQRYWLILSRAYCPAVMVQGMTRVLSCFRFLCIPVSKIAKILKFNIINSNISSRLAKLLLPYGLLFNVKPFIVIFFVCVYVANGNRYGNVTIVIHLERLYFILIGMSTFDLGPI